ncbi:MAG: efflux RND transporter periplasmic adaptor subunit [Kangiellaceae bacterium]|nr:efflux RND transporter periplasmic adaptor subunit [Kangiellaceae bacterium]
MPSMEDKNALLSELKITEKETANYSLTSMQLLSASILSAGLAGFVVYLLISPSSETKLQESPVQELKYEEKHSSKQFLDSKSTSVEKTATQTSKQFQFSNSDEVLNASGYITARRIATVSAETMGLITSVRVEEGMLVETGQILATLDSSIAKVNLNLFNARTDVLRSNITSIKIDILEAKRVLKRLKELDKDSYSSESQITRAQANVDKFESSLVRAKADVKVAILQAEQQQELLDNHTIRAPFSGVVTVKNAQPGEIVAPSSAGGGFTRTGICTIVDMDSLEIEVDVNEAYIGRVKKDQKVKANLDAYPNWNIPASVIAIIPTADRAKATVRVRIRIENKDSRILPDMGVKVAFLRTNK